MDRFMPQIHQSCLFPPRRRRFFFPAFYGSPEDVQRHVRHFLTRNQANLLSVFRFLLTVCFPYSAHFLSCDDRKSHCTEGHTDARCQSRMVTTLPWVVFFDSLLPKKKNRPRQKMKALIIIAIVVSAATSTAQDSTFKVANQAEWNALPSEMKVALRAVAAMGGEMPSDKFLAIYQDAVKSKTQPGRFQIVSVPATSTQAARTLRLDTATGDTCELVVVKDEKTGTIITTWNGIYNSISEWKPGKEAEGK